MEKNPTKKPAPPERAGLRVSPVLITVTLFALFLACFKPGVKISADDAELPGIYSIFDFYESLEVARNASFEITMGPADISSVYTLRPGFSYGGLARDNSAIERFLLERSEGVEKLWVVKLGDEIVGWVTDPSIIGELIIDMIAEGKRTGALPLRFANVPTVTRSYAPEGKAADPMIISARLIELLSLAEEEHMFDAAMAG